MTSEQRMRAPLFWYEIEFQDGTKKQYTSVKTAAEFWNLYKLTFRPKITADGATYAETLAKAVWLRSANISIQVYPLPMAIGQTTRATLLADREGKVECADCGEWVDSETTTAIDERVICEDCIGSYSLCERCEDWTDSDDTVSVYVRSDSGRRVEATWCEGCASSHATKCDDCDNRWSDDDFDSVRTVYGTHICQRCYESGDWTSCEGCGETLRCDDVSNYSERSDGYYCQSCQPDEDCIHDYSHKPTPILHGKRSEIHYGVELELTVGKEYASDVVSRLGGEDHVYLKSDSSISGEGFEVVTHPHTMSAHRELWEPFFAASRRHMKATENGMHVHIERRKLTTLTVQKMQSFLNDPANRDLVRVVADRDPKRWAECKDELKKITADGGGDRYQALNLCNRNTVEVRIFRGTVRKDRFFKNLEFCEALVDFCRNSSYQALTAQAFCAYVRKSRKSWLNLDNWLVSKGLLKMVPPAKVATAAQVEMVEA